MNENGRYRKVYDRVRRYRRRRNGDSKDVGRNISFAEMCIGSGPMIIVMMNLGAMMVMAFRVVFLVLVCNRMGVERLRLRLQRDERQRDQRCQ
jgi:hypothetical protein